MKKHLKQLDLKRIRITDSLFGEYVNKVSEKIIPHQWKILNDQLEDSEPTYCIHNFRIAAGEEKGERKGVVFQDTDLYKWLEAVAYTIAGGRGEHLEELAKNSGIVPAVNQIECHPLCYPKELIDYCQAKGIQVQAYAPLARGAYLDNDLMCVLGTKYAHTPAQVGLRWATQKGISVIPKSVHPDRIRSNADIFDFTIEQEDMDLIDDLNENFHSSHVPEDLRDVAF